MTGFGYMSRTITQSSSHSFDNSSLSLELSDELMESEDDATLPQSRAPDTVSNQYVVYSATFQVPAFYFTMHDSRR